MAGDGDTPADRDPGATRTGLGEPVVLPVGTRLADRYRIEELIGVGAMGMVYRARDELLDLDVALKVLRPELANDASVRERFRRELVLARQVTHPHVVRIHDLGEDAGGQGRRFLTMDLVPGRSLRELLKSDGPLEVERAVEIAGQLARALGAAHRQGVVHRDLKPSNILIDDRGDARVTDFGVARSLSGATVTREGAVVGTPDYLSPEQARGDEVDGRSDLYALGLILYEMLAGTLPFRGGTVSEIVAQRLAATPVPLAVAGVSVPRALERLVERCLAAAPEDRFQSADELAEALDGCLRTAPGAALTGRRLGRLGVATLAVALFSLGGWWLIRDGGWPAVGRPQAGPDQARGGHVASTAPSVAILPLADETGRPELAWASAGVAEILASALAETTDLRVVEARRVARTSEALGVAGGVPPASEAAQLAQLLDADRLVVGSLRAANGRLRIDVHLLDARGVSARGEAVHLESGPEGDLFTLVGRLTAELRTRLEVAAPAVPIRPPTSSPAALAAYAQGLDRLHRGDAVGAASLLERAVDTDPGFAAAWMHLARAYDDLGRRDEALSAARRAVSALPPNAGRLEFAARAEEASLNGDLATAEQILRELVGHYPQDVAARVRLAEVLGEEGRFGDASSLLREVTEEEPSHPQAWYLLGKYAILSGDAARAVDEYLVRALVIQNRLKNDQGRADALNALGIAYDELADSDRALAHYREAADLRRAIGDRRGYAATLTNLGAALFLGGDLEAGRQRLEEALAILQELGDTTGMADLQNELGVLEEEQGRYQESLEHYRQALALRADLGDRRALAESYNNVGFAYYLLGELDHADVYWQQSLGMYRESRNREGVVLATQSIGQLELARGRWSAALEAFLSTLEESQELGLKSAEAVSLGNLGRIAQLQGRYAAALDSYDQALALLGEMGDLRGLAEFGLFRVSTSVELGLWEVASRQLEEVRTWVEQAGNREQRAELDRLQGELAFRGGDLAAAQRAFERALAGAEESGSRLAALGARLGLARARSATGGQTEALGALESVVEEADRAGYRPVLVSAALALASVRLDAGDPGGAEEALRRALRELDNGPYAHAWRLHALLARALEAQGARDAAAAEWAPAGAELERVRRGLEGLTEEQRAAFDRLHEVRELDARTESVDVGG